MATGRHDILTPVVNDAGEPSLFDDAVIQADAVDSICCGDDEALPGSDDDSSGGLDSLSVQPDSVARLRRQPFGSISIDMDTLSDYAGGYGFSYDTKPDPVYTKGLVRFLDLLGEHRIKATIFVIGRDAVIPSHAEILNRAVAEGHELANHTMTHPRKLGSLDGEILRREIMDAHDVISRLRGDSVKGFRAPCYDVSKAVLKILRELDYSYDSSVHPSIIGPVIDLVVLAKSKFRKWEMRPGTYAHLLAPIKPYQPSSKFYWRKDTRERDLIELPLTALPWSRLPFYGTFTQMTGMNLFRRSLKWLRTSRNPLNFHFHAVELLDLHDEGVNENFSVHPGMTRPIGIKRQEVNEMLTAFSQCYELVTLENMATHCLKHAAARMPLS